MTLNYIGPIDFLDMPKKIVIAHTPLSVPADDVWKLANPDPDLCDAIATKKRELRKARKEVWARRNNIIATEEGYYMAVFEDEITKKE